MFGELAPMTSASSSATPPTFREAVLIVEDEAPLCEIYSSALAPYFDVVTALTVKEAELALRKRPFRVVVADHLMPGGNGLGFLVHVREEYPEIARVLVTGFMKPEMLLRAVNEAAVFRYLLKPVELREFISVVRDAAEIAGTVA